MIQRIQSLYLLIAIIIMVVAIVFFCNSTDILNAHAVFPCLSGLSMILSTVALLKYTNRRLQMKMANLSIVILCVLIILPAIPIFNIEDQAILTFRIQCAVALLFNHMAWRAIRRDEKKVKDADRIR